MKIVLQQECVCTRWPCCICDGHTEKHAVYALAQENDGTELGFVCERCIEAGLAGIKTRALEAANNAVVSAAEYLAWAKDFQNEAVVCPTMPEWEAAEQECNRNAEREYSREMAGEPTV